jgi:tRNA 2-thiouridine synthesizing protein A
MTTEIETTPTATTELDCTGLLCPLPVYKAALALNQLEPGDVLQLVTTDPGALEDIPAMTRQRGDLLVASTPAEGSHVFLIQKGDGDGN